MSKKRKSPEVVYAAMVNVTGLYHTKPIKCTLVPDNYRDSLEEWWDATGNFDVKKLGVDRNKDRMWVTFASTDIKETEAFIQGACAVMTLLNSFCKTGP